MKNYLKEIRKEFQYRLDRDKEIIKGINEVLEESKEYLEQQESQPDIEEEPEESEEYKEVKINRLKLFIQNHPYIFIGILLLVMYWGLKLYLKTQGFDLNLGLIGG